MTGDGESWRETDSLYRGPRTYTWWTTYKFLQILMFAAAFLLGVTHAGLQRPDAARTGPARKGSVDCSCRPASDRSGHKPTSMPTDRDVLGSVSGLLDRARTASTLAATAVVQGKLDELTFEQRVRGDPHHAAFPQLRRSSASRTCRRRMLH